MQPTEVAETNSDGTQRITRMKYPADYASGSGNVEAAAISAMQGSAHMHSPVLERWVTRRVSATDSVVSAELTTFREYAPGQFLPYQRLVLNSPSPVTSFAVSSVSDGSFTRDGRYLLQETAKRTTQSRAYLPASIAVVLVLLFATCDQDPLGRSRKTIVGGYVLEYFPENQRYYLAAPEDPPQHAGGSLEGAVVEIGWTAETIVAWRQPLFGGDTAGWMVVDVDERRVTGPFLVSDLPAHARPAREQAIPVDSAWKLLSSTR